MRIISGEARGRRITTPAGEATRPTSDRVKEALFSMLGESISEAYVLDLFAGSGNLGLESISRGADFCIFIDSSRESIKAIHENVGLLKYEDYCEIYLNDAFSAMDILCRKDMKFDIIFLDPPYHKNTIISCLQKIAELGLMKPYGLIVAEHDVKDDVPDMVEFIEKFKTKIYGNTAVSLYRRQER